MLIDHYTIPIPPTAFICPDWPSLCEEADTKWGHCTLDKKYGGFVIEDKGAIVLVCTDDLCAIIEEKDRQAQVVKLYDLASSEVSVANYTVDLPASAKICANWTSLKAAVKQRPGSRVVEKFGGFVIEENGTVVFACDEGMCEEVGRPDMLEDFYKYDVE
jgi:hypothetical protein